MIRLKSLSEIKILIKLGCTVHYGNNDYEVQARNGELYIVHSNGSTDTINAREDFSKFYTRSIVIDGRTIDDEYDIKHTIDSLKLRIAELNTKKMKGCIECTSPDHRYLVCVTANKEIMNAQNTYDFLCTFMFELNDIVQRYKIS